MSQNENNIYSIKASAFAAVELPTVKEVRNKEWVSFGANNLFPQELIEYYNTSAMHGTAVDAIVDATKGKGIKSIGDEFVNTNGETMDEVFEKITFDYVLFGSYALNMVWNKEGNKVVEIYHIPVANVRSGKFDEDMNIVEYYYSRDWSNTRKNTPKAFRSFDPTDNRKENSSQIYYCNKYQPGQEYYGLPSYTSALTDIDVDARISRWHSQNLKNGLSPSMFISFRQGVPSPSEREAVYKELTNAYSSEENAGKFFASFSRPGEEPTIQSISSDTDSYYTTLEERISSRVLTAHRISSPLLVGIKDASGFSSNADEIKVAYAHFMGTVIQPIQEKLSKSFSYMLKFAGYTFNVEIIPNEILIEETTDEVITEGNTELKKETKKYE